MVDQQRSAPAFVEVKAVVQNFASDFFAGGVASGFTKSAMAPVERCVWVCCWAPEAVRALLYTSVGIMV